MLFNNRTAITGEKQSQQRFASHYYNNAKKGDTVKIIPFNHRFY